MKAIRLPKKPDSVVNALRDAILSGQIASGTELTQVELAESLGVSRMPVREALIILEYQGLMERLPNQHVRVAEIDRAFFTKIVSFAADLECRLLCQTPMEAETLSDEMCFHRTLVKQCGNAFFRRMLETVTESTISYGIGCPGYDSAAGLSFLRQSCMGENRKEILTAYFSALTDAIMEVRGE